MTPKWPWDPLGPYSPSIEYKELVGYTALYGPTALGDPPKLTRLFFCVFSIIHLFHFRDALKLFPPGIQDLTYFSFFLLLASIKVPIDKYFIPKMKPHIR